MFFKFGGEILIFSDKAKSGKNPADSVIAFEHGRDLSSFFCNIIRITQRNRGGFQLSFREKKNLFAKFVHTEGICRRNSRNGKTGFCGKRVEIDFDSSALRVIKHIYAQKNVRNKLGNLEGENKIPFKAAGVADNHGTVKFFKAKKVSGNFLLRRIRKKGICARKIDQFQFFFLFPKSSFGHSYCFS